MGLDNGAGLFQKALNLIPCFSKLGKRDEMFDEFCSEWSETVSFGCMMSVLTI